MNAKKQTDTGTRDIELAQYQAEQAKKRFQATMGSLQYRLKPGTLANHAWDEVRGKSSVVADDAMTAVNGFADGAMQAVKERPMAASGAAAAVLLFLARAPLWRAASRMFGKGEPEGVVHANLPDHEKIDLTAPRVQTSLNEGVNA
jgi:hypothetical protein